MSLSSLAQLPCRLEKLAQFQLVLPLPQSPKGVRTLGGQAVHVSGIPVSIKKMKSTSMNGIISYRLVFMRMYCQHESCRHRQYLSRKFHWLILHQSNSFSKSRKNSTPGPGCFNIGQCYPLDKLLSSRQILGKPITISIGQGFIQWIAFSTFQTTGA